MFFILSKTLSYLTLPFTVVSLLFIAGLLLRKPLWKKRMLVAGFALFFFFSNEFIANEMMCAWETGPTSFKDMRHFKLAIVLTGATIPDLKPDDRVYFHRGADRVIHTVQLYKLGLVEKILISGGTGSLTSADEPEADKFRKAMLLMGIPDDAVIIENKTRNTAESAIAVRSMLKDLGYSPTDCLLVTSAFHMRRSLACYRKAGVPVESFSTDFYGHARVFYFDVLFVPQVDAMMKWNKLCKEWVGMIAYKIVGYI
jgi:uncharacterized SAM-binding protein YcdF (DUF218 family)